MKGDIFIVRPAESIPVDSIITEGVSAINESALTGESIPKVSDKICAVLFVPVLIIIAVITVTAWLLARKDFGQALYYGIAVLVISCPCALGLATPVAIMVGNGIGAKNGILFKNAVSLEETGKTNIVALDKTGTVTAGESEVTDIVPSEKFTEEELLELACSLETKSEHPLAKAVVGKAEAFGVKPSDVSDFKALAGNGITASLNDGSILTGVSVKFVGGKYSVSDKFIHEADKLAEAGKPL